MPLPIRTDAVGLDLSSRFQRTTTVAASPTAAAETVIATLNLTGFTDLSVVQGIYVSGWAAFTVGTAGATAALRIRQTNVTGSTIVSTGATTGGISATNLVILDCEGFDSGAGVATYVLTLQVGSASAGSTVSGCMLRAIII